MERDGDTLTRHRARLSVRIWSGEADMCEEVLRMVGYERIPSTRLRGESTQGGLNPHDALHKARVRRVLRRPGL